MRHDTSPWKSGSHELDEANERILPGATRALPEEKRSLEPDRGPRFLTTWNLKSVRIWNPFPDAPEPALTGYHSKEGFISQKKLVDKAVLIRKYQPSNGL
jgi:hypothetical protein